MNEISKDPMIRYIIHQYIFFFNPFLLFARSRMRRNSHVRFWNRGESEKKSSTITPKEPDSVNNIEEE